MELKAAEQLAIELMTEHGLRDAKAFGTRYAIFQCGWPLRGWQRVRPGYWSFEFDKSKQRFGVCK